MVVSTFSWLLVNQFLMDADVTHNSTKPPPHRSTMPIMPSPTTTSTVLESRYATTILHSSLPGPALVTGSYFKRQNLLGGPMPVTNTFRSTASQR